MNGVPDGEGGPFGFWLGIFNVYLAFPFLEQALVLKASRSFSPVVSLLLTSLPLCLCDIFHYFVNANHVIVERHAYKTNVHSDTPI